MPIYVRSSRIDWGWGDRTVAERAIIERRHRDLTSSDHGQESFARELAAASRELPGVPIAAVVEYDGRSQDLFRARDGAVKKVAIRHALAPGPFSRLPWNDPDRAALVHCGDAVDEVREALEAASEDPGLELDATDDEIELPISFESEPDMRRALTFASERMTDGEAEYMPDAAGARWLVRLRPGSVEIRRLLPWPESDSQEDCALIGALWAKRHSGPF